MGLKYGCSLANPTFHHIYCARARVLTTNDELMTDWLIDLTINTCRLSFVDCWLSTAMSEFCHSSCQCVAFLFAVHCWHSTFQRWTNKVKWLRRLLRPLDHFDVNGKTVHEDRLFISDSSHSPITCCLNNMLGAVGHQHAFGGPVNGGGYGAHN